MTEEETKRAFYPLLCSEEDGRNKECKELREELNNSTMDQLVRNFVAYMGVCTRELTFSTDVEAIGSKLNIPFYRVRERDKEIKKRLREVHKLITVEGEETCDRAFCILKEIVERLQKGKGVE